MNENDLSYLIRGAAFKVHSVLGPGLLESVYEVALSHELKTIGLEGQESGWNSFHNMLESGLI